MTGVELEEYLMSSNIFKDENVYMVETIGRDTTLIVKQDENDTESQRVIVDAQYRIKPGDIVKFKIKPNKLYIFNKETGELLS